MQQPSPAQPSPARAVAILVVLASCTSSAGSTDSEPQRLQRGEAYYAVDRAQVACSDSDGGPSIVDVCSFVFGDSVVIAEVTGPPRRVRGCPNGTLGTLIPHFAVPLRPVHQLAGARVGSDFELALPGRFGTGIPVAGEQVLVSFVADAGDNLANGLVYVSDDPEFVEPRVSDAAIDLPGTLPELEIAIATAHSTPSAACSTEQLARRSSRSELITYYRDVNPDSCTAAVHADDGQPSSAPPNDGGSR